MFDLVEWLLPLNSGRFHFLTTCVPTQVCMLAFAPSLLFLIQFLEFFLSILVSQTEIVLADFLTLCFGLLSQYCVPCGFRLSCLSAYLADLSSSSPIVTSHLLFVLPSSLARSDLLISPLRRGASLRLLSSASSHFRWSL